MKVTKIEIVAVSEQGTFIKLNARNGTTVLHTTLQSNNVQLAQFMAQWFVSLPRDERENLARMIQELNSDKS